MMTMGLRSIWLFGLGACLLMPDAAAGQTDVILSIASGLNVPGPSSRFDGTEPGYVVEGSIGVALSEAWQVGAGGEWGTFGAGVPEFAEFAPFDHAPWLEYNMLYGRLRRVWSTPASSIHPFLDARLGWVRELAEYSGAEVRRAGLAVGASAGLSWEASGRLSLSLAGTVMAASLGSGQLKGVSAVSAGSLAGFGKLSAGLSFRLGNGE